MSKQKPPVLDLSPVTSSDGGQECCAPLACEPLNATEAADLAPLFKALGDPARLRLLSLIACHEGGEACVCDLTAAFELSAPTISHHLKVLKQAGLIDSERRRTWVYYWLRPQALERLSAILGPRIPPAPFPSASRGEPGSAGPCAADQRRVDTLPG